MVSGDAGRCRTVAPAPTALARGGRTGRGGRGDWAVLQHDQVDGRAISPGQRDRSVGLPSFSDGAVRAVACAGALLSLRPYVACFRIRNVSKHPVAQGALDLFRD